MNQIPVALGRLIRFRMATVWLIMALAWTGFLRAEETSNAEHEAAKLLPSSVIAFIEFPNLGDVATIIFKHPLRQRLMEMPLYDAVLQSEQAKKLEMAVAAFESSMDESWTAAVQTLSGGGVTVALDATEGGVALLMKSSDEEALKRFRGFLLALRLLGGESSERGEYRGFAADAVGDGLRMALLDNWFLLTNKSKLGKTIIDQYLDRGEDCLQSNGRFRQGALSLGTAESNRPAMIGYLDLEAIRDAGLAKELFSERVDNFFGELVFGGILANLRHAPFAMIKLHVQESGLELQMATPHQREWESPREYYFGFPEHVAALPLLEVKDRLFALSAYRDLSQLWLRSGDLLSDRASDELAKADTQLTTFFSGRDFGEDILGSLESDIQLVGKSQSFENQLPKPAIKLPAFALQARMKDPDATRPELRRIFQSFIGFLNVIGAMNGQPQLDLGMDSDGEAQLYTATFVPDLDDRESVSAAFNFNFSPTIAFAADHLVLSSSIELARELVELRSHNSGETSKLRGQSNTSVAVDAGILREILHANRAQLVANNMLEKGHSNEAAEAEIGLLVELVGFIQDATLTFGVADDQLQLKTMLNLDSKEN